MPASVPFAGAALSPGPRGQAAPPLRSAASVRVFVCACACACAFACTSHAPLRPLHSATSESPGAIVRRPHLHARARVPRVAGAGL
jgi:hypothetical protein